MRETLLLNIGNTHTGAAVGSGTGLRPLGRFATRDLLKAGTDFPPLGAFAALPCLVACVVPAAADIVRRAFAGHVRFLEPAMIARVDFSGVDMRTVGADRLANVAAALALREPPLVVIDCGTAITTVVLDAARCFRGGAILPGRQLLRQALNEHTGQLPLVPLQDERPPGIGTTTRTAILAGVDVGVLGAVEAVLNATRTELGQRDCPVLVVGGDGAYFARHLPGVEPGPPDFTLRGLLAVAQTFNDGPAM